jgi:GT2 family glycosyltransferase/MoaA/NifB/PqqE/SkfB family radical SAM enzyme/glycosyltransferase involved in cell wall biosynthesis
MKSNYPKVSIITVNFNGKKYLKKLLDSVFCLNYPKSKIEVIFIDNLSTDNSVEFVKKNYRKVKIIKNSVNNYCKALNLGIENSRHDYVALINNDMRLDKNWLAELIKVISKGRDIACVGSKVLDMAGRIQNASSYELPNFYWGERGAGQTKKRYDSIEQVSYICGAAVLYRKDVFLKVGLFDEDFVMFVEDMDMSLRLRQRGYRLVFVPNSIVYHKFHGTTTEEMNSYYIERNRLLFLAKHYPHKLSSSLLGSGYFTAKRAADSCAKIYSILPDIIMKLVSTHPFSVASKIVSELFEEINKIVNYENDLLVKELHKITEDRNITYTIRRQISDELERKNREAIDKDARINLLREEIQVRLDIIQGKQEELKIYKEELANRRGEIANYKKELAVNKDEFSACRDELANLSGQLRCRMDEVLIKDGQLIEDKAQLNALRDELSGLSGQLRCRMEEAMAKDARLIEDKVRLNIFQDEISHLAGELAEKLVTMEEYSSRIADKENELEFYKSELSNIAGQLRCRMDEVLVKDAQINRLRSELDGIYQSEGFRFILRPLWMIILHTRNFLIKSGRVIARSLWLATAVFLTPAYLILSVSLFIEYITWMLSMPLLKRIAPKRKISMLHNAKVSLVIPNWNGINYLKECLSSVFSSEGFIDGQNEVLVVDDGSTDNSVDFIKTHFPRVRLIRNKRNKGFAFTCNRGVKAASNEIVVLINNDIILTKGFLKPLIRHLANESVFAVTPKLYAWDRKTFVWGMHMGHFENGYVRLWNEAETGNGDKVSEPSPSIFAIGGAMAFRKKDFLWLGGFDHIYRPNCWEDIDISYRAWKRGLKVLYEPKSLMYHKGRATLTYERHKEIKNELLFTWKNITDGGIIRNHLNLFPRNLYCNGVSFLRGFFWALNNLPETMLQRITERAFDTEAKDSAIFNRVMLYYSNFAKRGFRHRQDKKPSVLIISRFMPYPLNSGGKIRIHNLVKLLSDKYNFILLSLVDHEDELNNIPELKKIFSEVYPIHTKSDLKINPIAKLFYPRKYKFGLSYSQELIERLREIQDSTPIDLVHIESNELLYLTDYVKHAPIIYTEHDISILNPGKSYYKQKGSTLSLIADYLKRLNFHIARVKKVDKVIILSREDKKIFKSFFPGSDMAMVPTGVDLKHFSFEQKPECSGKLIFVGHYRHYPNEDAVVYFVNKILPLIKRRVPGVEMLIVGSDPTPRVEGLKKNKNVTLVGEVEDVKVYLGMADVFVNSVRVSAGIKGKVLEAMASGVPVVSTTTGSYGIDAIPGKEIIIADAPREFARQVIRLLFTRESRLRMSREARRLVEAKYDWVKIADKLDGLYKGLIFDFKPSLVSENSALQRIIDSVKNLVEDKIQSLNGLMSPKSGPEELHIELTYNCDSKCIMCDLWDYHKRYPKNGNSELSLDEIKRFVEGSKYLENTKTVVLSGGEPFMRKDLVDICGFFSNRSPETSIGLLTNAMNTEDIILKTRAIFEKFNPGSLWLGSSLDGLDIGHDRIRGVNGAFKAFNSTMERCKKEFPQIKISATFTLTPYNIDQLIPAKEFAENNGLDFYAQMVVPKESKEQFNWTPQNLDFAQKEIIKVIRSIIGDKDFGSVLKSVEKAEDKSLISKLYYWSHLLKYQTNPQRFFKKCVSGAKFAMFNPYGDLFFCPNHKKSVIGNIRKENFDDIWVSDRAEHMRDFIKDNSCHCWLVCIVFPVLEKALNNN